MNNAMNSFVEELKKELREEIKKDILAEMKRSPERKVWMNKKETAAYLGVSPNTLTKYLYKFPNFPVSDIGGVKRYNVTKVNEFIEIIDSLN